MFDGLFASRHSDSGHVLGVHTHFIDKVAVLNGAISGLALYPQVIKVLLTGTYNGVSPLSFIIILLNNIVWSIYAFHRGLISLLLAALLNSLAALVLLIALVGVRFL